MLRSCTLFVQCSRVEFVSAFHSSFIMVHSLLQTQLCYICIQDCLFYFKTGSGSSRNQILLVESGFYRPLLNTVINVIGYKTALIISDFYIVVYFCRGAP